MTGRKSKFKRKKTICFQCGELFLGQAYKGQIEKMGYILNVNFCRHCFATGEKQKANG